MNNKQELQEELDRLESKRNEIKELDSDIWQTKKKIVDAEREEEKERLAIIQKEKDILMKKALFKGQPFFKCPRCKKSIPVSNVRRHFENSKESIIVEGVCFNKKCQNKITHSQNEVLRHPVMFEIFDYGQSRFKRITMGYP